MPKEPRILDLSDPRQRMAAVQEIVQAKPGHYEWTFHRRHRGRTLSQNALLWGVFYPAIAPGMSAMYGETVTVDDAHEFCKARFLSRNIIDRNTGEIIGVIPGSTAVLTVPEFSEYLDKLQAFAADYLGVEIPPALREAG